MADKPPENQARPSDRSRVNRLIAKARILGQQGVERLEAERTQRPSVRLAFDFYERDRAFAGSLLAGGLSVKLFLWFLPSALTFVVILGAISDSLDRQPEDLASDSGLPAALAGFVADAVASSSQSRFYLGALGIFLTLWAGTGVVRALRLVSRLAWQLRKPARVNPLLASLAVVGFVTAILLINLALQRVLAGSLVTDLLGFLVLLIGLIAVLSQLLWSLPHPPGPPWTAMLPGAILVTLGLLATRLVTTFYFAPRLESADNLYGGLGISAVFLGWLYILSRTLVAAIALNATLWHRGEEPLGPAADLL